MIASQVLQNTIDGLKQITGIDFCVADSDAKILAATFNASKGCGDALLAFSRSPEEISAADGFTFFKVNDEQQLKFILAAKGEGESVTTTGRLAAFQLQNLLVAYKERYDIDNFIKNLILDNLLLVDIYNRAKKLGMSIEARRAVVIIEANHSGDENVALEVVKSYFSDQPGDYVTAVDEKDIILVKELADGEGYDELESVSNDIIGILNTDAMTKAKVAYGTIVGELKEVSRSYKEAHMAFDVGRIFFSDKDVIAYNNLGIGRLIYQLPIPLCRQYIREVFDGKSPEDMDEETLATITQFFDNSLNVSETARQLYIHRNTLVYRLDKLEKTTGLDLRNFDDAITFKIALMVVKYMKYMEKNEF